MSITPEQRLRMARSELRAAMENIHALDRADTERLLSLVAAALDELHGYWAMCEGITS